MISTAIIYDDQLLVRSFYHFVETLDHVECIAVASSSSRFLKYFKYEPDFTVDVIFLDVVLNRESGLDLIPKIKQKLPNVEIVIFTEVEDIHTLIKAFSLGASGYLLRNVHFEEIKNYFNIVKQGGAAISPKMAKKMVEYFAPPKLNQGALFNPRENQALKLLAGGLSYKEVAHKMDISVDGVRFYIKKVYGKLNINSKSELINMYLGGQLGFYA